jgi:hypothetical protein
MTDRREIILRSRSDVNQSRLTTVSFALAAAAELVLLVWPLYTVFDGSHTTLQVNRDLRHPRASGYLSGNAT